MEAGWGGGGTILQEELSSFGGRALLMGGTIYGIHNSLVFFTRATYDNFLIRSAWITRPLWTVQRIITPPKIWKIYPWQYLQMKNQLQPGWWNKLLTFYQMTTIQTGSNWKHLQMTKWTNSKYENLFWEMPVTSIFFFSHNVFKTLSLGSLKVRIVR